MIKKYCVCGCGNIVKTKFRCVRGHGKYLVSVICECGCGELTRPGNRFIFGHQCVGKARSLETKKKISKAGMGRLVSEETREKLRGHAVSEETREKISRAGKGRIVSEETKKKISVGNRGKIRSEEFRKKVSGAQTKSNSESRKYWNEYHPYLERYQYRILQDKIKERDCSHCVLCNEKSGVGTHHVVPVRIACKSELCDHESNMLILCKSCHAVIESCGGAGFNSDKWKEFLPYAKKYLKRFGYEEILANSYME